MLIYFKLPGEQGVIMKMLKTLFLCLMTLGAFGCENMGDTPSHHSDLGLSITQEKQLSDIIDHTMQRHGVAGYSIGLLRDGELVFKTYGGFANVEHQVLISPDSRYQIYSASKLFFNVALMQLIENGDLDPDASLGDYLPELPDKWATLTIRQTWSHMTGTTDILDLNGMEPTAEEALQSVISIPLKFVPGTKTEYNQTNFLLLKMVFEAITQTDYRTYLENNLLASVGINELPLGDLSLTAPHLTTNYEPHGYEVGTLGRRMIKFPPYVYTSAGINITLDEFVIWWQAVLGEQFINEKTLKTFWEPARRNDGSESTRSNGWERQHKNGMLRIGHGGGARIHLFHYIPDSDPERSVTVIYLNNGGATYFDHRSFGDELAKIALHDE